MITLPLPDLVWALVTTPGTGSTLTLGAALMGYRLPPSSYSLATMPYKITDGAAWETGSGVWTYTTGTWTVARNLRESSTGSVLNLSGSATIIVTMGGVDDQQLSANPPIRLTANATLALGQSYKGAASALNLTLPASPGEGGLPISYVGVNGDEATNPPTFTPNGANVFYAGGQSDTTGTLPQTGFPIQFVPRSGGWDVI